MAAYGNMDRAVAGLTQGVNVFTHSRIAAETIKYGCAVFAERSVRNWFTRPKRPLPMQWPVS